MLATLHSMHNDIKPPHDFPSYKPSHNGYSPPESPRPLPSLFNASKHSMNNSHRGLPAPLGLNLAPVDRNQASSTSLGNLPAPPSEWAGHDESMRNWLQAKAEEDRRKQEEERTKQETLRLDQRKIEQSMLQEAFRGGVPPPMVPLIFAGMSGQGVLSSHTLDWAQQYLAQLSLENQQRQQQQFQVQQQQQQQQQQLQQQQQQQIQHQGPPSPELRRDSRMIPPNPYAAQQQSQSQTALSTSHVPASRTLTHSSSNTSLSRLNTAELQPQPLPSSAPPSRHSTHPLQQSQTAQPESSSGPSLFFHHWTPPNNTNNQPPTPSSKSQHGSPFSQNAPSHLRSDYQNTPKKRKLGGGQPSNVPPTSQPSEPQVLELQKQTAELETHVPDCYNKIANLVEQLEAAKEQLKTSNDELERLREELQSRSSDTHELQAQLEVAKENTATLECQLGSRRKQILQLEGRISCYKANETKHAREMKKLKDEMLTSKAQITWERDQMQANIHSLSAIQKEMGSTLRECEARGDLLQKQLIQFETEKLKEEEQHATEKRALQGEISCLKEELDQRRHDVEAVNMEFDKHKQKYDMLTTERDEANAKIDKLMAELSFRDNQITEVDRELSQLRAQNAELISVSETRKNLIDELKMNVEELEKEVTMQKVVISDRDEEKREAIRQLCISLEHYRNGYKELLQAFIGFRRHHAVIAS